MILAPGDEVERYRVVRVVGQGGMAVVYEVVHTRLGTCHALKVLRRASPSLEARLLSEGRVQASLRHPQVVPVTDVIDVGETLGLVMDLVRGVSLATLLAQERLGLDAIDGLALDVLSGVGAAHAAGVVHRDLKPSNILVEVDGDRVRAKVADFGLVHVLDGSRPEIAGTPSYMAPEQVMGARVDTRADVFALGAILYELVAGTRAFPEGARPSGRMGSGRAPTLPPERVVPLRMKHAVEAALQVDPSARPVDAAALRRLWLDGCRPRHAGWPVEQLARVEALLEEGAADLARTLTLPPTSPAR